MPQPTHDPNLPLRRSTSLNSIMTTHPSNNEMFLNAHFENHLDYQQYYDHEAHLAKQDLSLIRKALIDSFTQDESPHQLANLFL